MPQITNTRVSTCTPWTLTLSRQSHSFCISHKMAKWMQEKAYDLTSCAFLERGSGTNHSYYEMDFIWSGVILKADVTISIQDANACQTYLKQSLVWRNFSLCGDRGKRVKLTWRQANTWTWTSRRVSIYFTTKYVTTARISKYNYLHYDLTT